MPADVEPPKTLEQKSSGATTRIVVPTTRISDAQGTQDRVNQLIRSDDARSKRRAMVRGLVDGNPPYQPSVLKAAGRSHQCNVNWRTAESYLDQAKGLFYDLFSETPTYSTVTTHYDPMRDSEYSRIITEEFHDLLETDDDWDYCIQLSQEEMILIGDGPIWFNDADDWHTEPGLAGDLLVPERAKSNTNKWEEAARIVCYQPSELYKKIMYEAEATRSGWTVQAVKEAIVNANPLSVQKGGTSFAGQWEWCQQQLKNQAFNYDGQSKDIQCYHYFVKEFPTKEDPNGGITHVIGLSTRSEAPTKTVYLFKKERRFANWRQLIHPMYYATERGGFHHSVTGMGQKMYAAMEYENRLLCNLADKAFRPDVLFAPKTAQGANSFAVTTYGEHGLVAAGFDVVQVPQLRKIEDGLAFRREIQRTNAGNLSQYRQELQEPAGNPETATGRVLDAQQQTKLGKTQLNRYYKQLDWLFAEKYRRASKPGLNSNMPGAKAALEFQERCQKRGVPAGALRTATIKATRIAGQGSDFMRQQSLQFILGIVAMLPEDGRENLLQDVIASKVGQVMVKRYYPSSAAKQAQNTDHYAMATLQVAAMKEGVAPVVTGTQNSIVYAQVFLQAAAEALKGAAQGVINPPDALAFVELAGGAIAQHIAKLKSDPSRKQAVALLEEQWKRVAQAFEQLQMQWQKAQQQQAKNQQMQQRAQAIQQGQDPETQLKAAETQSKIEQSWLKTRESLAQKDAKSRQALALKDAQTAHQIQLDERKQAHAEATATE